MLVTDKESYVAVTGGRVWYGIVEGGGGVPVVVVHGGPGVPHGYLEPLAALADERPVVFYDQLGAGRSEVPDDLGLWTNERLVEELATVLDALAFPAVHLLGHSWGALIVAEYALRRPERVVSLVLANPALGVPRFAAGTAALRAALPADVRDALDRHEAAGTTDSEEYEAASAVFYCRHVCRLDPWPEPVVRAFAEMNMSVYERMWGPNEFTATGVEKDYDLTDRLGEVTVPALFLCGRFDEARPEDTAFFHSLVQSGELVVFEQSSHNPHLEEPERYFAVVRDFLQRAEHAGRAAGAGSR